MLPPLEGSPLAHELLTGTWKPEDERIHPEREETVS